MSAKQTARLLERLERAPITSLEALNELGIARCGARVWDLRRQGYNVHSEIIPVQNRYGDTCHVARYSLAPGQQTLALPMPRQEALAA